jgi:hypothetical protein
MDDRFLVEALDRYTPTARDAALDWRDVLRLAEIAVAEADSRRAPAPRRSRQRLGFALVAVGAAILIGIATPAGDAIARTLGDFSAWLTGLPGKQAPSSDQQAFDRATRTWFGFPHGTQLHRLLKTEIDGTTFALDGYRVGDSLCLQLVATGAASGSRQSCAPLSNLKVQKEPALVVLVDSGFGIVAGPHLQIGPDVYHSVRADVTIGIVADGIQQVETAGTTSTVHALVGNDAFMAVVDRPPVGYRTRHLWATAGGKRVAIPLAQAPFGDLNTTSGPTRKPLGPSIVQRRLKGGQIGWLKRRDPRGQPVPKTTAFKRLDRRPYLERVLFQRLLAPNPNSQLKEIISLDLMKSPFRSKAAEVVCDTVISGAGGGGGGCDPVGALFGHGPLSVGEMLNDGGDQYETLGGVASDDVKRLELFLATGERIAVPLKDNAFVIQAERSSFPARLVAYDRNRLVIGVDTFRTDAGSTGPPTVSAKATWRTIIRARSPSGQTARMMIAPKIGGGTCWAFRAEPNGGSQGGCFTKHWKGPALQISYSEFDNLSPRPAFIQGQVRPDIASLAVHLHAGQVLHLKIVDGLALGPLPRDYKLAGGEYVVGLNGNGKQIARLRLFQPPKRA